MSGVPESGGREVVKHLQLADGLTLPLEAVTETFALLAVRALTESGGVFL
jgi:hypothetical protein